MFPELFIAGSLYGIGRCINRSASIHAMRKTGIITYKQHYFGNVSIVNKGPVRTVTKHLVCQDEDNSYKLYLDVKTSNTEKVTSVAITDRKKIEDDAGKIRSAIDSSDGKLGPIHHVPQLNLWNTDVKILDTHLKEDEETYEGLGTFWLVILTGSILVYIFTDNEESVESNRTHADYDDDEKHDPDRRPHHQEYKYNSKGQRVKDND